jgi:hypothetical protein
LRRQIDALSYSPAPSFQFEVTEFEAMMGNPLPENREN